MKYDVREGTYVGKRGKEFLDYLIQCGMFATNEPSVQCLHVLKSQVMSVQGCPPSDASKMMEKGMTMKAEVSKIGDKKWRGIITCKEAPMMNDIHLYEEDKEVCIDDPMFGGKLKVKMTCPDENTIQIWFDHSKMGKSERHEVYSDQGVTVTTKHTDSGASITENLERVCCEEGSYRYVGNENGEEFFKASGEAPGMTPEDIMKGWIITMKTLGDDCWQLTECQMGQTFSIKIPMNQEVKHPFPGYEQKMIWTRYSC